MMAMTTSNSIKVKAPGLIGGPASGHDTAFGFSNGALLEEFIGNSAANAFARPAKHSFDRSQTDPHQVNKQRYRYATRVARSARSLTMACFSGRLTGRRLGKFAETLLAAAPATCMDPTRGNGAWCRSPPP